MKFIEILVIFFISCVIMSVLEEAKEISKVIKKDFFPEIIFINLFLCSLYNAIRYYCLYEKMDECNDAIINCYENLNNRNKLIKILRCFINIFSCICSPFFNDEFLSPFYNLTRRLLNLCSKSLYNLSFIGRLVYTILSLESLFFSYNIIIQYLLIFLGILIDIQNKIVFYIFGFFYILFLLLSYSLLLVPTYEFITFPYLRYKNPYLHLETFRNINNSKKALKDKDDEKINIKLLSWGIGFLIFFILSFIFGDKTIIFNISFLGLKDYYESSIIVYNLYYYMTIFWCYFYFSLFFLIKFCVDSIKKIINKENKRFLLSTRSYDERENDRLYVSEINLLSFIINPYLDEQKNSQNGNVEIKQSLDDISKKSRHFKKILWNIYNIFIKSGAFIISLLVFIYYLSMNFGKEMKFFSKIIFIFIYLMISAIIIWMNYPIKIIFTSKYKDSKNIIQVIIGLMITLFFIIILILLSFSVFIKKDIEETNEHEFQKIILNSINANKNRKNLNNICDSKIYSIPIYLYIPFINDAYYYNRKNNFSSFNYENYTKIFYNENYKINEIRNLTIDNDIKTVKMVQYNVEHKKEKITILSIKGTNYKRDFLLDAQLYFPSVLLTILNTFSTLDQQKEQFSFKFIEYGLSIPYRLFFQFFMMEKYLDELKIAYDNEDNKKKFYENIVIVGHSLGGGLAKIFGKMIGKKAISLSGPGINAFHSLWKNFGNSSNNELNSIDIIPDLDPVPRVEISGGTIYRIICLKSPLECHGSKLSLCESLIICRNPNAYEYCRNIAGLKNEKDIADIFNKT